MVKVLCTIVSANSSGYTLWNTVILFYVTTRTANSLRPFHVTADNAALRLFQLDFGRVPVILVKYCSCK